MGVAHGGELPCQRKVLYRTSERTGTRSRTQSGTLTVADVRLRHEGWKPTRQADPNFGYSRSAFWLRTTLVNPHPARKSGCLASATH